MGITGTCAHSEQHEMNIAVAHDVDQAMVWSARAPAPVDKGVGGWAGLLIKQRREIILLWPTQSLART